MRDPKRIDRILDLVRTYWHTNPDMRLGQIVCKMTPLGLRECLVEDKTIEQALREECAKIKDSK